MNRRGFLGGLIGAVVAAVVPKALMPAPVGESLDLATIDDLVARATRDEARANEVWRRGIERQASQGTCFDSFIGPDENGSLFVILHPRQAERLRRACRPVDGRSSKKARAKRRGW